MKLHIATGLAFHGARHLPSSCPRRRRYRHVGRHAPDGDRRLADHSADRGRKPMPVKQTLGKIKLPPGFHIDLYALVPDARHMAVGPQGVVTFVGTRKSKIYAVTDRSRTGVADDVKEFAPSIPKVDPNGPCFSKDGFLYVVELNRVLAISGGRVLL